MNGSALNFSENGINVPNFFKPLNFFTNGKNVPKLIDIDIIIVCYFQGFHYKLLVLEPIVVYQIGHPSHYLMINTSFNCLLLLLKLYLFKKIYAEFYVQIFMSFVIIEDFVFDEFSNSGK